MENKEVMASEQRTRSQTKKTVLTTGVIDTLEDVKPSILKYVDPAMLKDPFEAVAVKHEVDDDCIKVEHELDPLSVTDIKPQDVIIQLVSDIQESYIPPNDMTPCTLPLGEDNSILDVPVTLKLEEDDVKICKDSNITSETLSLGETDKGAIEQELTETKLKVEVDQCSKEKGHLGSSGSLIYKLLSGDHNQKTLYKTNQVNYFRNTENLVSLQEKTCLKTDPSVTDSYSQDYHSTQDKTESHNFLINDNNDDSIDAGDNEFIDDGITSENQQVNQTSLNNSFEQMTKVKSLQNISGHKQSFSYKPVNGDLHQSACIKINQRNVSWSNKNITQEGENCHDLYSRVNNNSKPTNASSNAYDEDADGCEIVQIQIGKPESSDIYKSYIKSVQNHVSYIPKTNYFSCKLCKKKYNRKHKLRVHEESKCGSLKLYNCNVCNKAFADKHYLQYHLNNHMNRPLEKKKYNCQQCDLAFPRIAALNRHQKVKHEQRLLDQTCQYCQKTYQSMYHLKDHIKRQHLEPICEMLECAHCSKTFSDKKSLVSHMKRYHLPDQIRCSLCNLPCSSQENLEKHMLNKHSQVKKLICDHCGKTFKENYTLINHLRTHSGEKPFMCQDCGKCFRTESNLVQHSVVHSERRPFACNQCSSTFRIKNHLRQHMAVHGLVNTSVKCRKIRQKKPVNIKNVI